MTNPEQELVLRRGPHLWVVDGIATILLAALLAETVNPVVGSTVVIMGAVLALNRPRVTLRTLPVQFLRYGVELSPAGIANGPVLLPWKQMVRVEVTDGWFFRRVRFVRQDRVIVLRGPWVVRTVFKTGYAEFDAGVEELRRWTEAYAPQAEVVVRRRGQDWLGDLLVVLVNCVAIIISVIARDVLN